MSAFDDVIQKIIKEKKELEKTVRHQAKEMVRLSDVIISLKKLLRKHK